MNIYISNLNHQVTNEMLETAFAAHGQVSTARVIQDQFTGYSRGFGFVEMPNEAEATQAIAQMNGVELDGRAVYVKEARPKEDPKDSYTVRNRYKK